jgi:hypothetical protein
VTSPLPPIPPMRKTGCSPVTILAVGCGGALLVVALLVVGLSVFLLRTIQGSDAYKSALGTVQASPAVHGVLGEPIVAGWWVTGSIQVSGPSGSASLSFPVSGPKGEAMVFVEAQKRAGEWTLGTLIVEPEGGDRLDLLQGPDDSR